MSKKKEKKIELERKKTALQAEIARRRLLLALRDKAEKEKRPVAIMRKIEDKIPPAFSEEHSLLGKRNQNKSRWL